MTQKTEIAPVKAPEYYQEKYWRKFSSIYDYMVRFFFFPFGGEGRNRRRFMDFINPVNGEQVLDVCCGTGTLTAMAAHRVGETGLVTGIDLSPDMIGRATAKINGLPAVFKRSSADNLPFDEDAFDRVYVSYGLHEMPEAIRKNALKQIYRVLKPGASFFVFDYNMPRNFFSRMAITAFMKTFEEKAAYDMSSADTSGLLEEVGFTVRERRLPLGGMFQMIRAEKPASEKTDG